MRFVWKVIWKSAVVFVAVIIASLTGSQAGWSGAELIVNAPLMGLLEDFVTVFVFAIAGAMTVGPVLLVHRIAKPALWIMGPILLYFVLVPGVWNGWMSDFDATRFEVLRYGYANAYALEHMTLRGRYRTCEDQRIELTEDGKDVCERTVKAAPGEPIPGSEHRCGFLGGFSCFDIAPENGPSEPKPDEHSNLQG
jgi:hypothetical protein